MSFSPKPTARSSPTCLPALFPGETLLQNAVRRGLALVRGSYAIAVVNEADRSQLIAARNESPLVLGLGDGENFIASDVPAILPYTRRMVFP